MYWAEAGVAKSRSARARAGGPNAGVFIGTAFFGFSRERVGHGDPASVPAGVLFPLPVYTLPGSTFFRQFLGKAAAARSGPGERVSGLNVRRLDPSNDSASRSSIGSALGEDASRRAWRDLAGAAAGGMSGGTLLRSLLGA